METIKITDNPQEMISIGRKLVEEKAELYNEKVRQQIYKAIEQYILYDMEQDREDLFYRSVYDYWVYGLFATEDAMFHLLDKGHDEKNAYISYRNRYPYLDYLNKREDRYLLTDKYQAYTLLKPYFKRDMIKISGPEDFEAFLAFIDRHPSCVIKPIDQGCSMGVRKCDTADFSAEEKRKLFGDLLKEGRDNSNIWWALGISGMILEELIVQDAALSAFHPASVNVLRINTLRDKNGKIRLFKPWIKTGAHGGFAAAAATYGFCARIDEDSGRLCSDGYVEDCTVCKSHPDTGIQFEGYQIPCWNEMKNMCIEAAKKFPTLNYIGWDMALSAEHGWMIVEGNIASGFALPQMIEGCGHKEEFEALIGWKPDKQFWWQE